MDGSEATFFRDQLRQARAAALRDSEGYQEILFTMERIGIRLRGELGALGHYKEHLSRQSAASPLADSLPSQWPAWHTRFDDLYDEVVHARNDALHYGAFARLLTSHAVQLALVLEDALMKDATKVSQFMVRAPTTAMLWQPVSFVRQVMLANSYSVLPVFDTTAMPPTWRLLSEGAIAKYLRSATTNEERKRRLAGTVEQALCEGRFAADPAKVVTADEPVMNLLDDIEKHPVLVVNEKNASELVGILTAFDIL